MKILVFLILSLSQLQLTRTHEIKKLNDFNKWINNGMIVGFGDSLTKGAIKFEHDEPYIIELRKQVSIHNEYYNQTGSETIIQFGIPSETTSQMLERFPNEIEKLKKKLRVVIILGGTNDLFYLRGYINIILTIDLFIML